MNDNTEFNNRKIGFLFSLEILLVNIHQKKSNSKLFKKKAANYLAAFFKLIKSNYFPLLTEPAKSEPALNFTTFLAAILISLPV